MNLLSELHDGALQLRVAVSFLRLLSRTKSSHFYWHGHASYESKK